MVMRQVRSTPELLRDYANLLDALRERGVVRSSNNPVADYAEALVCRAFGYERALSNSTGYDARDPSTMETFQVKARRLMATNASPQLGSLRGLDRDIRPFDYLIGVLFDGDFTVRRAAVIPFVAVRSAVRPDAYVGGMRFVLRDSVWTLPGVSEITSDLRAAAAAWS